MKRIFLAAAALFVMSTPAFASTVSVATDPAAPIGNFGTPGNTATAGYNLTLGDSGGSVVGVIAQTGGDSAGAFANLYFDLNPTVGDGSDLGFEMSAGGVTAFIPGKNGMAGFSTAIDSSLYTFSSATAGGLTTLDFSLANSLFTGPIAGLAYYGPADGSPVQTFENIINLRLSQSLSYSVAGGATYGPDRLGAVTVGAAVPEPATWAMMLVGVGALGATLRRRRQAAALAA